MKMVTISLLSNSNAFRTRFMVAQKGDRPVPVDEDGIKMQALEQHLPRQLFYLVLCC
jgi:hypothetical protein